MRVFLIFSIAPLIGNDGGIRAIAPGAAAIAGFVHYDAKNISYKPFVWRRTGGFRLLPTAKAPSWGTAFYLSDDGALTIGYLHGENVENPGVMVGNEGERPIAVSDDANTILLDRRGAISIWREGHKVEGFPLHW